MDLTADVRARSGDAASGRPRSLLKAVALPAEHGGWSLTAEPALLGLLVVWSWAGLALGVAAMLAFMARTPIKVVLVDRWRDRWLDRTRLALRVALGESVVIVGLVVFAVLRSDGPFWAPFMLAAPLIGIELWFDMRSRSRRLVPELAGAVGISSVAAAIVLAGGGEVDLAIGMWVVIAARAVAAIPHVRVQIARFLGRPTQLWHSDVAQGLAVAVTAVAWISGLVPFAPVVIMAVIAAFNVVAVRRAPRPAKVIGFQQMGFGFTLVAVTAVAVALA